MSSKAWGLPSGLQGAETAIFNLIVNYKEERIICYLLGILKEML